jgi:hypothetical protein
VVFKLNLKAKEVYYYLAPSDDFLLILLNNTLNLISFSSEMKISVR